MPGGPAHRYEDRVTKKRKVDDDVHKDAKIIYFPNKDVHLPPKQLVVESTLESHKWLLITKLKELWFKAFKRDWLLGAQDRNLKKINGKKVSRQQRSLLQNVDSLGRDAVDAVQAFTSFYGEHNNFFRISVLLPYGLYEKGRKEFKSDALKDLNGVPTTAVGMTFSNEFSQNFVENFINSSPIKAQIQQRLRQLVQDPIWLDQQRLPNFKNVFFKAHQQIEDLSFKDVSLEFKEISYAPWSDTVESMTFFTCK